MRITIEAAVSAFAKPRGSVGSWRNFREPVTVEIREVSSDEAPVAMQWDGGIDGPRETRWFDGSHWHVLDHDTDVAHRGVPAAEVLKIFEDHRNMRFHRLFRGYFEKASYNCVELDRSKFVEFDDSGLRRAHDEVRAWADDCLIVDGMLYTRCPEPMYHVGFGIEVVVERRQEKLENRQFDVHGKPFRAATIFRADRYEDAVQSLRSLWPKMPVENEPPITILLDESARAEVDRESLIDTGIDVLTAFGRVPILDVPPAVLGTLPMLASCFWKKQRIDVDPDAVHTSLVYLSEAVKDTGFDMSRMEGNPAWAIDAVVARWDNRPLDLPPISTLGSPKL
jgi:hypothetical protein